MPGALELVHCIGICGRRWLLAAVLLGSSPARAHDFWIEPSSFHPLPGATVTAALYVGQDLIGDPVPYMSGAIDRFFVRQDGEDQTITGSDGQHPAGALRASGNTTAIIAYSSNSALVELPADRFEAYLKQYSLVGIIAERAYRDENTKPARECFYRYAKALLAGAEPSPLVTQPLALAYEIVPDDDPTGGFDEFRARIFYHGEPLANALVLALHKGDQFVRLFARSDAQGAFSMHLPRSGVWLIKSVHMVRAGLFSDCDWKSSWASLTFEIPAKLP
ncbi:DUF4198 domain-containing protein [Sinorhizobium meliloti]|uniref:DUF4198 domain-containing protein n=1 Tax=Rhizobium meliloti TaxID=382 RepID=UPI0023806F92|nr:DUF4198 domain-containing protein [Sinorhizobium meliloti]MDE3819718.1 DUF4198 domain-containing protein [Sinorhizobium meliloti]